MTQSREVPRFAPLTLQDWFRARGVVNPHGPKVVLWPDTFNNYFHTDVGVAAVEGLEAQGYRVVLPEGHVCCGRPLYDYGFLDLAKRLPPPHARQASRRHPRRRAGGRDRAQLPRRLQGRARPGSTRTTTTPSACSRTSSTTPSSSTSTAPSCRPSRARRSSGGTATTRRRAASIPSRSCSSRWGSRCEEVTGGCCGLAGSWGFESGHYDVSMRRRRACAAPGRARRRAVDARRRQRLLLQDADRAGTTPAGARSTSRR